MTAMATRAQTPAAGTTEETDLFSLGQTLFETYAPPEIKKEYAFPTRADWDAFAARLEKTRETGSLAELAAYEPEVRAALTVLRTVSEYQDYADWLSKRLDEIIIAKQAVTLADLLQPPTKPATPGPVSPPKPELPPAPPSLEPGPTPGAPPALATSIPMYDLWVSRLRDRPRPTRADEFLPSLKKAFTDAGLPAELAWLAETESTFNPRAQSPVGARGMFQFMPITAKAEGLSLWPLDERNDPDKSARAAASLLRRLHGMFDSWPLALAAYNAGEGRVRRTLKAQEATTFAQIADALPSETRLYVPRVLATLAVREGLDPSKLAAPR